MSHLPLALRTFVALVAPLLGLALTVPSVQAAPAGEDEYTVLDINDPAKSFAHARKLWESGEFAAALPLFEQAVTASGSPNARLYVARCLRDLGRLPEAYEQMRRTVQDAMKLAEKEPRYAQTRNTAAAELALIESKVARVVVVLDDSLAGAQVTLNDQPLDAGQLGQPVAVAPGMVSVLARKADGSTVQHAEEIAAGAIATWKVGGAAAVEETPAAAAEPSPAKPKADESAGFGVIRGVGIGVAAVGVAGMVMFAVGRARADSEIATLEDECGAGPCTDPYYADVVDSGKSAETVAGIGLGIGIAGLLAGTAMIIFGGPSETAAQEQAWSVTPDGLRVRF